MYIEIPNCGTSNIHEALPRIIDEAKFGNSLPKEWQNTVLKLCELVYDSIDLFDFDETKIDDMNEKVVEIEERIDYLRGELNELDKEDLNEIDEELDELEDDVNDFKQDLNKIQEKA